VFWSLASFPPILSANPGSGTGGPLARLMDVAIFGSLSGLGARTHRLSELADFIVLRKF